jgi:3-phosphoshikimate 1-carboxyvinyltransferase
MIAVIKPSSLAGTVAAPASKSSMQRGCAAALISGGLSRIIEPGKSRDDFAAITIIKKLGAGVIELRDEIQVTSHGIRPQGAEINCGESGLSLRMFVPIIALSGETIKITGSGSLMDRPMAVFDEIFPQLGVTIQSDRGKLPLFIRGPLRPASIELDGSLSSQFLTGLLMAYSAANAQGVTIKVRDLKSKPYINLTLQVMKQFGLQVPENKNFQEFIFHKPVTAKTEATSYWVEKDWSNGAFLLVGGAIAGPLTVRGLDPSSTQADKAIMELMFEANAVIAVEAKGIKVHRSEMKGFTFNATHSPDLFPPLVAMAVYCTGESRITGVHRLLHKESNRAESLQKEFSKMGAEITIVDDTMVIRGGGGLRGGRVQSHHDHRVAMALAIAALKASGETIIENAEAVGKSYPDFFEQLKLLGATVTLKHE